MRPGNLGSGTPRRVGGVVMLIAVVSTTAMLSLTTLRPAAASQRVDSWTCLQEGCPRWSGDEVLRWSVDLSGAPEPRRAVRQIKKALAIIHRYSGLTFTRVSRNGDPDLTIRWGTAPRYSLAATRVSSLGGARAVTAQIVRAAITLQRRNDGTRRGVRTAVLMHELMHAVGIGHSHDRRSLMYPVMRDWRLSPGDRAALRWAGSSDNSHP